MAEVPATGRCLRAAFVVWLLAFVGTWLTLRHGLEFSPDAWQYWSGSISILHGKGYVDGHGLLVLGWPPGYSIYLAAWQAVFGEGVATVRLAECFALATSAGLVFIWANLRLRGTAPRWPLAVAAVAATLAAARGAGSERLMLMLLFGALVCIELLRDRRGRHYAGLLVAITLCCAAMGLVRHAALAFLPGLWFLLRDVHKGAWRRPFVALVTIITITSVAWLASRKYLGQASEGWFESVHTIWGVLAAMAKGLNRGVAPWPIGLLLFAGAVLAFGPLRQRMATLLALPAARLQHGAVAAFLLTSLAALFTMYVIVYVADLPNARFMRFASITMAVLLAGIAAQCQKPRLRWLLLAVILLPNLIYATKHTALGRRVPTTLNVHGGASFLTPDCTLGPPGSPQTRLQSGQLQVPEPLFRWQQDRLRRR